jgi:AAA15 family ATPase/GTPase
MRIEIIVKNYRCFPDSSPARIVIEDNWVAFLGVNNAGKSTLLKFFFEFRDFFQNLTNPAHWHSLARGITHAIQFKRNSVRDNTELYHNRNQRPLSIELRISGSKKDTDLSAPNPKSAIFEFKRETANSFNLTQLTFPEGSTFPLEQPDRPTHLLLIDNYVLSNGNSKIDVRNYVNAASQLSRTVYIGAFRNIINTGAKEDYFDIQVGDAFIKRWRDMQTGNSLRDNVAIGSVVSAIEGLFSFNRLEIQASANNDSLQVVIDHKPYKLDALGAGIAQFILVLANAAVAKPGYILIDEPELNLHPSLQLDFLTALGKFAEYGVLFSTHSIGLARSAADLIYSVLRLDEGVSKVARYETTPNLPEFLGALSYSSYQALGFNKVLLVEGSTEVRTIQQFLRMLRKDHEVVLLSLGGSDTIKNRSEAELNELKRITSNLNAIIDSEKASATAQLSPEREAFRLACIKLDIPCHVLERRATENYLTEAGIKQVKGEKYRQLTPYEKLTEVIPAWGKQENWKIASEMKWEDIKDTDLGKFLEEL